MAKAQYVGVNGVARKVKQPYIGVGGIARKVKNGYVGVGGVARQFFGGELEVGQSVFLKLSNIRYEFIVVHKGLPSSVYDSSCDGIWLLKKSTYGSYAWDESKTTYYQDSDIHEFLNSTTFGKFETGIQSIIKQVKIPHYGLIPNGDGSWTPSFCNGANGLSTKVFLLSYTEVMGTSHTYAKEEGAVLDYFNGASAADRIAPYQDGATGGNQWWLRSYYTLSTNQAWTITTTGTADYYSKSSTRSLRPAIILPHDIQVDSDFNIIA